MTRRTLAGLTGLVFLVSLARGIELDAIYPLGFARGTTNRATAVVKPDASWPPQFWVDPPGPRIVAETNKNRVSIQIPADTIPGPRLVRAFDTNGVSEFAFFVVGDKNEIEESEPNDHFNKPQSITNLPAILSGRLEKRDDVDSYQIQLPAGGWIDASVESFLYMSKVDAVLRIVTTNGIQLAWNHDYATFDPRIQFHATNAQTIVVQVFGFVYPANNEIRLTGGSQGFYRLRLATNNPSILASDETTNVLSLPIEARGCIATAREDDRFTFRARKDEYIEARVDVAAIGSQLDPVLRLLDISGKELARNDDFEGARDALLEWKAPAETNYVLAVSSLLNRGATNYNYRLSAIAVPADFQATWSGTSTVVTNGTTNTLKIDLRRLRGHTNALLTEFRNLPTGISSVATNLPSGVKGEVALNLIAAADAPLFQGAIQLYLIDSETKRERPTMIELVSRGENNGVPQGYSTLAINSTPHLFLTTKPAPPQPTITTNLASQ